MANFKTHFFVASGISGVAAIACMKAGIVQAGETPVLLGLGTFGGLLPDIDSDHSVPIKISFNLLAFALAFLVMFMFVGRYTVLELAAVWLGVFLAVRYLVLELFISFTTHRGAIHSLLAAVFFSLCTVSLSHHLFAKPYPISWIYGAFIGFGFVIHLLLDELFSVDLLNRRIKSSFGSALKIASLKYWRATVLLLLATGVVYSTVNYPSGFYTELWSKLEAHYTSRAPWLMPANGQWFKDLPNILTRSFCLASDPQAVVAKKRLNPINPAL
ncbi:MAG: metal-dependent hydrolase [Methylococcaceae bacterium]|nr:metal-dependent hydrolase [Methylococcaceae bacterium]